MQLLFQKGNRIIFPLGKENPLYNYNGDKSNIDRFILNKLNLTVVSTIQKNILQFL